jgi:imidazolonepropionase-like amidohydrolase
MMKVFKRSLLAVSVLLSANAMAETIAIQGAKVYTGTEKGVIENATVVLDDGKIAAINPASVKADKTIDGTGKVLTPGFIGALNQIGLVEVGAVSASRDTGAKKPSITFDPSLGFNPESSVIPFTRKGGITSSVIVPSKWGEMLPGQAFVALMNSEFDSVVETEVAVIANFGADSDDSRASSLLSMIEMLKEQKDKLEKEAEKSDDAEEKKEAKEPSDKEKLLIALLNGEKPLIASASRATDILHLIDIKKDYGVDVVISGGHDSHKVKEQLAKADVPVLLQVMDNLPGNFDSLHASLTTAAELDKAGIKVGLVVYDTHLVYNLRLDAGNAVSYGMSDVAAINAMTSNIADIFNLDFGSIEKGKAADVVLWSGDPLEVSSKVDHMWIRGEEVSTQSRQDKLRDRYVSKENKPRGYIK